MDSAEEMAAVRTLLVADDDPEVRRIVGSAARKQGLRVIEAEDGERALRLIREEKPDVVVLDIIMPKRDGRDVCRLVRADPAFKDVAIILFTAKDNQSDRVSGLQVGADDYITKPFRIDMLMRRIEHLLWKRQA
ncbi:MAG TPA: response regulator [Polyangia bacterium]|nr:response regulator [Polyangia bacterium]